MITEAATGRHGFSAFGQTLARSMGLSPRARYSDGNCSGLAANYINLCLPRQKGFSNFNTVIHKVTNSVQLHHRTSPKLRLVSEFRSTQIHGMVLPNPRIQTSINALLGLYWIRSIRIGCFLKFHQIHTKQIRFCSI